MSSRVSPSLRVDHNIIARVFHRRKCLNTHTHTQWYGEFWIFSGGKAAEAAAVIIISAVSVYTHVATGVVLCNTDR